MTDVISFVVPFTFIHFFPSLFFLYQHVIYVKLIETENH